MGRAVHRASASSSASSSASIITLNLGVGCAPSCWPIFGFRNLLGARRGAEGSFLCSLITDFLAEGAGWGPAASVLKKFVRLASTFPSPPFGSSDFAGPRRPRLYGFHTHWEPFESQGTRAAKRYVNGNLVEREKGHLIVLLILRLNLVVGCATRCWPTFVFRN